MVKRVVLRDLKRALKAGQKPSASEDDRQRAQASALKLLDRSISIGHRRLAIIRLAEAVSIGASLTPDRWAYCEKVLRDSGEDLIELATRLFAKRHDHVTAEDARLFLAEVSVYDRGK